MLILWLQGGALAAIRYLRAWIPVQPALQANAQQASCKGQHLLQDGFVSEVDKYVQPGQTIKARIYNVDIGSNKVGLTMRTPEELQQRAERSSERSGERQDRTQAPVQARARRAPRGGTCPVHTAAYGPPLHVDDAAVHCSGWECEVPAEPPRYMIQDVSQTSPADS